MNRSAGAVSFRGFIKLLCGAQAKRKCARRGVAFLTAVKPRRVGRNPTQQLISGATQRKKEARTHSAPLFCFLYFIARLEFHRRLNTFFAAAPNSPTCTGRERAAIYTALELKHTQASIRCSRAFEKRVSRPTKPRVKIHPSLNLRVKEKSFRFCIQAASCLQKEASSRGLWVPRAEFWTRLSAHIIYNYRGYARHVRAITILSQRHCLCRC